MGDSWRMGGGGGIWAPRKQSCARHLHFLPTRLYGSDACYKMDIDLNNRRSSSTAVILMPNQHYDYWEHHKVRHWFNNVQI